MALMIDAAGHQFIEHVKKLLVGSVREDGQQKELWMTVCARNSNPATQFFKGRYPQQDEVAFGQVSQNFVKAAAFTMDIPLGNPKRDGKASKFFKPVWFAHFGQFPSTPTTPKRKAESPPPKDSGKKARLTQPEETSSSKPSDKEMEKTTEISRDELLELWHHKHGVLEDQYKDIRKIFAERTGYPGFPLLVIQDMSDDMLIAGGMHFNQTIAWVSWRNSHAINLEDEKETFSGFD